MKIRILGAMLLLALAACREVTFDDRTVQRVLITDFSAPVRALLPNDADYPVRIQFMVSGTISNTVTLTTNAFSGSGRVPNAFEPIRLPAGTYQAQRYGGDFYTDGDTELVVTAEPGTQGSLTIEWSR